MFEFSLLQFAALIFEFGKNGLLSGAWRVHYSGYKDDSVKRAVLSVLGVKSIYNMQNANGPYRYRIYDPPIYPLRGEPARFVHLFTATLHIRGPQEYRYSISLPADNCVSMKRAAHKNPASELYDYMEARSLPLFPSISRLSASPSLSVACTPSARFHRYHSTNGDAERERSYPIYPDFFLK